MWRGEIFIPKIAIVIPSYIRADSPKDVVEADGFKMLKRALGSLEILKDEEIEVILPFCIEGKGMGIGMAKEYHSILMEALANPFPFKRIVLTAYNLKAIKVYISQNGFSDIAENLDVCGFPNIRNCGLILSQASGVEIVIFLDNDEVVDTPDFLDIAIEGLLEQINGWKMDGKGGFYISKGGEVYEKTIQPWWQMVWRKAKLFEEVWEGILNSKERFIESPIVLGGNLVLTRGLFEKIPFDPLVPRGEDIDYLINARIAGFKVLFDKHLKIKHLPRERTVSYRKEELKGDIERFLYEGEKVKGHEGLNLYPYPGYFLKGDLGLKAIVTVILFSLHMALKGKVKDALEVYTYLEPLFKRPKDKKFYERFKQRWVTLMEFIRYDGLKDVLREGPL